MMVKKNIFEPRLVVIGGGTGLSTLLRGLKKYTPHLTAIVTVTDDGGSSGTIRRELGVLPPGDIRNCLVALSEDENLMARLFQYRFPAKGFLSKHSFGNLFLTAMSGLTGGFGLGIEKAAEVLAVRGRVLPVTLSSVTLLAKLHDGKLVAGETNIAKSKSKIKELKVCPVAPPAGPKVIEAILEADGIVIGPGSLYTSIIVNLLIGGITEALRKAKAPKIYICNVMTQPGETTGYTSFDHIEAIEKHAGKGFIDYMLLNNGVIPRKLQKRYEELGAYPVQNKLYHNSMIKSVKADLISRLEYVHHDSKKLAKLIIKIIKKHTEQRRKH